MLWGLWAKKRGEVEWAETQAMVRNVSRFEDDSDPTDIVRLAEITLRYTDGKGELQYGLVTVDYNSTLYDLNDKDTSPIRYNTARPDECEPTAVI